MDDFDRLERDFDDAPDELGRKAERLVRATTLRTEALGKANAPVLTGALKSSIGSDFDMTGDTKVGRTGPDISYDAFQEYGTRRIAPRRYMGRAADVTEPEFAAAAEAIGVQFGVRRG